MPRENKFKKALSNNKDAKSIVSSNPIEENNDKPKKVTSKINEMHPSINTTSNKDNTLKLIIPKDEKVQMTKLGTSIRVDLKNELDKKAKKYSKTTNNLVNIILDTLYDSETKKFNIDVDKKETFKSTSYHIKANHYNAIDKLCKSTGYNKSEVFNKLIQEGLKLK